MRLQDEVGAVRRETELPVGLEDAWAAVRDPSWLGEAAEVVEEQPPRRLALRWADDPSTLVDISLEPAGEDRTRVVVVEAPLRVLRAVGDQVAAGAGFGGPLLLAR
jgi:hypothetical protein